jgi:NAD(P)-dependent dehydrogenase (short-subunit alcohol dehydrogenase family)
MGREIVRGMLAANYTVIAHARSAAKAAAEVAKLRDSPGSDRVHTVLADLASKRDVLRMADEVAERFPKIDRVVHTAGIVPKQRVETADGLDECFATNTLAPFILTRRLEGVLRAGAPSRVIFFWGGGQNVFDVDDLQSRKTPYQGYKVYCQSKNACALLAQEFARRLAGSGISVFSVLPGLVNTEGMKELEGLFFKLTRPFYRTAAQGARTPLWVATEPGLEPRTGRCFGSPLGPGWKNEVSLPPNAKDPALAARVYAICEQLA